jgi:iron-sulfur cluster assembly protein
MEQTQANSDPLQESPPSPDGPISLTSKAVRMIALTREEEKLDPTSGLRVAVRGGGCSGLEYALDFELEARETDHVLEYDDLRVFVDPVSARYLQGTQIDYSMGATGAGFKFNNPNASGSCGCGSSFAV